jgi:hypothetical protein
MPTQSESPVAVSGTSQKTLQLLRQRLRQLLRVTLVLAICLALAATALAIWWLTSLNGLPDIGDPFDVAAFRALRIPDDQNAFTFLRRANQMLTPEPDLRRTVGPSAATVPWSKADPKLRAWVEANRQALELFQQGAEQSDAILELASDALTFDASGVSPLSLSVLALLEGSKRQESGDTAGAWDCYRAVLRMTAHVSRRGSSDRRFRVNIILLARGWLRQRLATWAADRSTTIPQLKSALDEVLKTEPRPEWDSFALKIGYLEIMRSLEEPMDPITQQEIEGERTYRLGDMQLSADIIGSIEAARRFLLREPERSRRVLRLLCANWLTHVETPELRPRKPAVRALLTAMKSTSVALYPVSPDAPAAARALPPQEVASWLVTTHDAKLQILSVNSRGEIWPPNRLVGRRAHRELVIMLATEIYHRERGALPPSEEVLVGTYLKSLPDDGSADRADEMTPTVE